MPLWLQDPGAWIAMGISLLFVVVALVMHRVIVRVLKNGPAPELSGKAAASSTSLKDSSRNPDHE